MDGQYKGLSLFQLKAFTRKKLIENGYNETLLSEVVMPEVSEENMEENEPESSEDFGEETEEEGKLNVINETNEIFYEH